MLWLPLWTRKSLFALVMVLFWFLISLPALSSGDPLAFQASGSLVVAAGIILLATRRLDFSQRIQNSELAALLAAINRLEALRKLTEERLHITFDLHMLQIAELSRRAGVPNPNGPETTDEIRKHAEELERRIAGRTEIPPPPEETDAITAINDLTTAREFFDPWLPFLWRLELLFIIFGTLQWGYGNQWVVLFYANAPEAFLATLGWPVQ